MSFLSGLLTSIGDDAAASAPASARPAPPKRKADNELTGGPAKRPTTPIDGNNSHLKRSNTPSNTTNGTASKPQHKPEPAKVKTAVIARPSPVPGIRRAASDLKSQAPAAAPLSIKTDKKPAIASTKPATPTADKPPPKKGSYADIIARAKAKAAEQAKQPVGIITHKQGEKIDRTKALKEATKEKSGTPREKKAGDRSRTGSAELSSRSAGDKSKQRPKSAEKSQYRGSARPTTPVYTGSARPGQNKKPPPKRYDGYVGTDEEMDDYDEEEDYYSDESDMEAGAFDVEREEQEALRQARRDDAAELALENKLKRDKLERKKRLEELVAGRKKNAGY